MFFKKSITLFNLKPDPGIMFYIDMFIVLYLFEDFRKLYLIIRSGYHN